MTFSVLGIFLPLYFQEIGLSIAEIGILLAIGPLMSLFTPPLWGYISDKTSQVKRHIIRLIILFTVTGVALFLTESYIYIFLAMILAMFFYTPIQPLQDILTLNTVKRYGGNYGNVRLWGSIGFAIICLLIGMFTDRYGIQLLVFVFITISLATLISSLFLEESKPESEAKFINVQDVVSLFRNKKFLIFLIFIFIVIMPSRIVDSFLGIHIKSLGGSDTLVGTASTIAALSEVPFFIIVGILLKRINPIYLILIGSSFYLIRALCVSLITQPEHILYMQFLFGVAFTFIFVASMNYVMSIVSSHVKGTALSIFFAIFWGLTGIVGNLIGGIMIDNFSSTNVYLACAGMITLGIMLGLWLKRDKFVTA